MHSEQEFKECFNRIRERHKNIKKPIKSKKQNKKYNVKPIVVVTFNKGAEISYMFEIMECLQKELNDYHVIALQENDIVKSIECINDDLVDNIDENEIKELLNKQNKGK